MTDDLVSLLDVAARLADALPADERGALAAYCLARDEASLKGPALVDVLTGVSYDLGDAHVAPRLICPAIR